MGRTSAYSPAPESPLSSCEGSDSEPSDTSRRTRTAKRASVSESEKGGSTTPPSSPMCERSTDCPTVAEWISSLPVSPANPSPSPAESGPRTTSGTSGLTLLGFLEKCARGLRYWKTSQGSWLGLMGISEKSSLTFPSSGSMLDGRLYQRSRSAPRICAEDYGLLPTPAASTYGSSSNGIKKHLGSKPSLETMARKNLWPTPVAGDSKGNARHTTTTGHSHSGTTLTDAVRMWPTPKNSPSGPDFARMDRPASGGDDLATAVARLEVGGQLNPTWVEWLMGWNAGWSDCAPLETDGSRSKRSRQSGGS